MKTPRSLGGLMTAYVSPLGWLTAGLAVVCLVVYAWGGWHELLALSVVCAVMLLSSLAMSLGNTSFSADLELSQGRVSVGDEVKVRLAVSNPGNTPTVRAQGDLPLGQAHERFTIPMLGPSQSKHVDIGVTAMNRAVLSVGPLKVRKGDPFGLIRHERSLGQAQTLYIHPRTVRLQTLNAGLLRDLEGQPSGQIVDDDLDFYGLREYESGDDMRNVHWLSSAKTGSLMIRQYEATRRTDSSLTLDLNPEHYRDRAEFELAVSAHASLGLQCLQQDRPLACHTGSTHTSPKEAMGFLDLCSAIAPDPHDNPNLAEATLTYSPAASFYFITVGSLQSVDRLKRMAASLPPSAACLLVQTRAGSPKTIREYDDFTLITIGHLDDLAMTMGVLA
ncbi:DUF58 domain-containing protein [Bifidobacterium aemilianum]|uniref:DUF58 domain-containing protein n=1 Tax=Bifidobacterium aemilianum TaxID=2493120 RepID=A0A366K9B3_9BIFI|nr:DUF58 domain-containing protein [Bifidobacterium aemilianum]RBP97231.1 DUF58 domain-containing protein [Bifidobacterium aemilianum]